MADSLPCVAGEPRMSELSRLRLRCRRGMKELDVIFMRYLEKHYPEASEQEKKVLDEVLDLQDPILFGMILGMDTVPEKYQPLIQKLATYS